MQRVWLVLASLTLVGGCAIDPNDQATSATDGPTATGDSSSDGDGSDCVTGSTGGTGADLGPDCQSDVTPESIEKARVAIDDGATEVALDASGCLRYVRTLSGDALTHEEIVRGGIPVETWDHSETESLGQLDRDENGTYQTVITVTRGATATDAVVVTERGSPVVRRTTVSDTGTRLHVVEEDLSGSEPVVTEYDTEYFDQGDEVDPGTGDGACTDAAGEALLANWSDALPQGLKCLEDLGLDKAHDALAGIAARGIVFECMDLSEYGIDAAFSKFSWRTSRWLPIRRARVFVHGPIAGEISPGLLFHELMHGYFPPHDHDGISRWSGPNLTFNRYHLDQVYACQAMCFEVGGQNIADKCMCATCLDTDPCDPRCADLPDCPAEGAFRCPCENNKKDYPDVWSCAVDCHNDLACYDAPKECPGIDFSCG